MLPDGLQSAVHNECPLAENNAACEFFKARHAELAFQIILKTLRWHARLRISSVGAGTGATASSEGSTRLSGTGVQPAPQELSLLAELPVAGLICVVF